MNQYNDIYFLSEILKSLGTQNESLELEIDKIIKFLQLNNEYDQLESFKKLEKNIFNIIDKGSIELKSNLDIENINLLKKQINDLIKDIEYINNNHLRDYNYIEAKLRKIIMN